MRCSRLLHHAAQAHDASSRGSSVFDDPAFLDVCEDAARCLVPVMAALQRRRAAGILMPDACRATEVAWFKADVAATAAQFGDAPSARDLDNGR
jgi:hypothetical protein